MKETSLIDQIKSKVKQDGVRGLIVSVIRLPFTLRRFLAYQKMLKLDTPKQRFEEIYRSNFWTRGESGSGEGSELHYTERLRTWLLSAIPKYEIQTVVDAPCGDFHWMRLVLPNVNVEYYGFDIVDIVVEANSKEYASESIHFDVADICQDELPKCDLLIVRDCLFHLSNEDIDRFLKNISRVDYKYLLTTTSVAQKDFFNRDIPTGQFRHIDLFRQPFNFDESRVLERVDDYPEGHPVEREMILVEKDNVPLSISHQEERLRDH